MKFFVDAFLYHNFGDDLFIHILASRYKKCRFYLTSNLKYKSYSNMKIFGGFYIKIIDNFIKLITGKRKNLTVFLGQKFKNNICIGGSMFMETTELENPRLFIYKMREKNKCKNRFIMGVNFGPYHSESYYLEYKNYFSNSLDVCFRDHESYKLFNELENIREAPDIVFSLDVSNIKIKETKRVVISVVSIKDKKIHEIYKAKIKEIIEYFSRLGYEIMLMSFCTKEGDDLVIADIKNEIGDIQLLNYSYTNDIEEALSVIANSEIVVASRYHASILGLLFEKVIIPIAYSDKTINALKSINYEGGIIDVRNISDLNVKEFIEENMKYKYKNAELAEKANQHFKVLDEFVGKGDTNG